MVPHLIGGKGTNNDVPTKHDDDASNASSSSDDTTDGNYQDDNASSQEGSSLSVGREESHKIFRIKMMVFGVIAIAATLCGYATYGVAAKGETEAFKTQVRT
jgi:hypothetical protein